MNAFVNTTATRMESAETEFVYVKMDSKASTASSNPARKIAITEENVRMDSANVIRVSEAKIVQLDLCSME